MIVLEKKRVRGFERVTGYEDAKLPFRSTKGSAGYDCYVYTKEPVTIAPHETHVFPTGIKAYFPEDEVLFGFIRSSIGIKRHCALANAVFVIDSDFYNNPTDEGHIRVGITNFGNEPVTIDAGERVCQFVFSKYLKVDGDNATGTRSGGYGSTGRK